MIYAIYPITAGNPSRLIVRIKARSQQDAIGQYFSSRHAGVKPEVAYTENTPEGVSLYHVWRHPIHFNLQYIALTPHREKWFLKNKEINHGQQETGAQEDNSPD